MSEFGNPFAVLSHQCVWKQALLASAIFGSALVSVSPAWAQADNTPNMLEEIVVTAQKRSQNLQDVPVAVSAISGNTLAAANITNASDISRLVPSISFFATSGAVQPFLRGIGTPVSVIGSENSVATYIDGVYMVRVPPALLQLNSVERLEVLKGPQGTLFGRNASGGLINVVTRTPSETPTMNGSIGYGNYSTLRMNIYGSTGLGGGVAMDVSAMSVHQADGWGKNRFTGADWGTEDTKAIRAKLRWDGGDTKVTIAGDYSHSRNDFLAHSQYLPSGVRRGYDLPPYGLQAVLPLYDISTNIAPLSTVKAWGVSATIEQDLSFAKITNITAYREDTSFLRFDADFSEQDNLGADLYGKVKQFSNEFQLASLSSSKI